MTWNFTPILKVWAQDAANVDTFTQTQIGNGIIFGSNLTSSLHNGVDQLEFYALQYLQHTTGLYNPTIPYTNPDVVKVITNNNNVYDILTFVRTTNNPGSTTGNPPLIGATVTTVNGIDIYNGGTVNTDWQVIVPASTNLISTGILSGLANADGSPNFLQIDSGLTGKLAATATQFSYRISGITYVVDADISITGLTGAPSTTNTALVNDTVYTGSQIFTKIEGEEEWGTSYISYDTAGANFQASNNLYQYMVLAGTNEVLLAFLKSSGATGTLINANRGIGNTDRGFLINNQAITILKGNYCFINSSKQIYTTVNSPTWGTTDPVSPSSGDFFYNETSNTWKRWNGTSWVLGWVYLGCIVCNNLASVTVDSIGTDFNAEWNKELQFNYEYVDSNTILIKKGSRIGIYNKTIEIFADTQITLSGNLEIGESETPNTGYYIYLDINGNFYFSTKVPRNKFNVYYHPSKYWRCVGFLNNDGSSNIRIFIWDGITYSFVPNGTGAADGTAFTVSDASVGSGTYALYEMNNKIPVMAGKIFPEMTVGGASAPSLLQKIRSNTYGVTCDSPYDGRIGPTELYHQNGYMILKVMGDTFNIHIKSFILSL